MHTAFTLNGAPHAADAPDATLLSEYLRDDLGLTGTHIGCDTSQCGSCHVLVDGVALKSCTLLLATLDGMQVTTIEGLRSEGRGHDEHLHPMQAAFRTHHGLQCGFCTPGMVMTGISIAETHGATVTDDQVRHALEGNMCRCTGYLNIVTAIQAGAAAMMAEAGTGV